MASSTWCQVSIIRLLGREFWVVMRWVIQVAEAGEGLVLRRCSEEALGATEGWSQGMPLPGP